MNTTNTEANDIVNEMQEVSKNIGNLQDKLEQLERLKNQPVKKEYNLDNADKLMVENLLLKEQCETLRREFMAKSIEENRKELHEFFIKKYTVDLDKYNVNIDNGKLYIIPK